MRRISRLNHLLQPQFTIGPVMKGIFKYVPFAQTLYRYMIYSRVGFSFHRADDANSLNPE
jgi:hypothetical protein